MRVLSLIHQDDAGPGVFADELDALGVEHEVASWALGRPPRSDPLGYDAVLVFGGSMNVDDEREHAWLRDEKALVGELIERGRPLLGVCLGSQLVAEAAGAEVRALAGGGEIGWHEVELEPAARADPLLGDLPERILALEWHRYGAGSAPAGMTRLAHNGAGLQAFRVDGAPAWGIQFHAEVDAATLARWVADEDGIDRRALSELNARELPRWNAIGRGLVRSFVEAAAIR